MRRPCTTPATHLQWGDRRNSALCHGAGAEVRFGVHVRNDNRAGTPPLVRLKAHGSPGDQGEPVVTVMLPEED